MRTAAIFFFFVKQNFSCEIPCITQFVIVIPGFPESESYTGNAIPSIPSDTLGISNRKSRYARYINNMWQSASIDFILQQMRKPVYFLPNCRIKIKIFKGSAYF